MNLDDVLLWLNDRLGKHLTVEISAEIGDEEVLILSGSGPLERWGAAVDDDARPVPVTILQDLSWESPGLYTVGETVLNVTRLGDFDVSLLPGDGLMFDLGAGVRLKVIPPQRG